MSEQAQTPEQAAAASTPERNKRKEKVGKVVSDKAHKSIVVAFERKVQHPLYGKYFTKTTTLMAHDEQNEAHVGDTVKIMETRPISKRKNWRLVEIIEKAK
jgi:small subunit ribosomal protein S17